jgi:hypothetical protein
MHIKSINFFRLTPRYLADVTPPPAFLPITISVSVPAHGVQLKKIIIKPTDTAKDIKSLIEKHFVSAENPILGWNEPNFLVLGE